jgi:hypothetical protein
MDFLNNKYDNCDNSSSDYSDEERDYIDYDSIEFNNPIKNKDNIYIANLDEKIILELDNLEVFECIEEEHNKYVIFNLDLDNDDHNELIEILYNLDEKALEKCFDCSKEWFHKEMNEKYIENLYIPLYIDNYKQKGHVLIKVLLDTNINIDRLHISNINIIEIKGLIFYKNRFLYHIILKDILKEDINLIDDINSIDNIDIKDIKDTKKTIDTTGDTPSTDTTGDTPSTDTTGDTPSTDTTGDTPSTDTTGDTPSTDTTGDTPSIDTTGDTPSIDTTGDTPSTDTTGDTPSIDTTGDMQSTANIDTSNNTEDIKLSYTKSPYINKEKKKYKELLDRKRLEVKQTFIESEKSNKEAAEKRIRAIESANELRKIENNFNNV